MGSGISLSLAGRGAQRITETKYSGHVLWPFDQGASYPREGRTYYAYRSFIQFGSDCEENHTVTKSQSHMRQTSNVAFQ